MVTKWCRARSMAFAFSLIQMLVCLSYIYYVMFSIRFFHFGLCGRKFVLCLIVQLCAPWQHACTSLQACRWQGWFWRHSGIWRKPPCLPWYFVVSLCPIVIFLEDVTLVLSQILCNFQHFLYQHIVHIDLDVVYNHLVCLCGVHIQMELPSFIGYGHIGPSYCSTCWNYCGVPVHKNMSSTKLRLLPLFCQLNLLNIIYLCVPYIQCCREHIGWCCVILS